MELAFEHPFLFQMDVAGGVACFPADARRVAVFHRRVKGDVFHHFACPFRCELRFACADREPVRVAGKELRRHEGVVVHVRTDVVGGTLPAVELPLLAERVAGAGLDAFAAVVTEVGFDDRIRFYLGVGQHEDITLEGAEVIGEQCAGEPAFAEPAENGARFEIKLFFGRFTPVDIVEIDLRIGAVLLLHDGLVAALGECLEAVILQNRAGAEQGHRHDGFLHGFDAVGGVLIVGGSLFDAAPGAAEHAECRADHGLCPRKNLPHRLVFEPFDVAETDKVGAVLPEHFHKFFLERVIHNRFFSFKWL